MTRSSTGEGCEKATPRIAANLNKVLERIEGHFTPCCGDAQKGATLSASSVPDPPIGERRRRMKKVKTTVLEPDMRAEYDFRGGVRGKYAARYAEGTNVVLLEPDVAELFPDSRTVNDALRALVAIVDRRRRRKARPAPATARKARRS